MTDFIAFIVAYQALIREVINGVGMVLFLTLTLLVMVFMWDTWVENSSYMMLLRSRSGLTVTSRDWRETPGIPTACALWWVFAAETYRTGAIWWLYNVGRHHHRIQHTTDISGPGVGVFNEAGFFASFGYLIAGVMLCGGLLRAIYIFTPPGWKHKVWVYASLASVLFILSPTLYHYTLEGASHGF